MDLADALDDMTPSLCQALLISRHIDDHDHSRSFELREGHSRTLGASGRIALKDRRRRQGEPMCSTEPGSPIDRTVIEIGPR